MSKQLVLALSDGELRALIGPFLVTDITAVALYQKGGTNARQAIVIRSVSARAVRFTMCSGGALRILCDQCGWSKRGIALLYCVLYNINVDFITI